MINCQYIFVCWQNQDLIPNFTKPNWNIWTFKSLVERRSNFTGFTSCAEYAPEYFPEHCSSVFSILTPDLVPKLFNASLYMKAFGSDEAYYVGALTNAVQATLENISPKLLYYKHLNKNMANEFFIVRNVKNVNDFHMVWLAIIEKSRPSII